MRLPFRPIIASMEKELSHGLDCVTDLADEADSIFVALIRSGWDCGGDGWCWLTRLASGLCVTSMGTAAAAAAAVRTSGRAAWGS